MPPVSRSTRRWTAIWLGSSASSCSRDWRSLRGGIAQDHSNKRNRLRTPGCGGRFAPGEWLRHLNHGDLATPPLFMAFDLLRLGDKDYRPEPLKVRRRALGFSAAKASTIWRNRLEWSRPRGSGTMPPSAAHCKKSPRAGPGVSIKESVLGNAERPWLGLWPKPSCRR
jgi:hypothetical protein